MIVFREITVGMPFRYLWLKYVTGINLSVHCARCLKGEYSGKINPNMGIARDIVLDEFPAPLLYLCGVSTPYLWERNFHLAMAPAPGESFRVTENSITLEVENARRVPIETESMAAINHPKIADKAFHTCRNWQFANMIEKRGIANL